MFGLYRRFTVLSLVWIVLILSLACQASEDAAPVLPTALVEQWSSARVLDATPPKPAPARAELRFDDAGVPGLTWRAVSGIQQLKREDGRLMGRSTDEAPILALDVVQPLGVGDELWSVAVRMRTTAGRRVAVHPMPATGPPLPVAVARADDWPLSSPAVSGEEFQTYEIVLDRVFTLEMPVGVRDIRTILLRPTDVADATFAIESVRLVFRQERLAGIASGPGWHGLAETFRETLVTRSPEVVEFDVTIPSGQPWLDLAAGTVEARPPKFVVEVGRPGEAPTVAATLTLSSAEAWQPARVDLAPWRGEAVTLRLRTEAEAEGTLAFWGTPTIRGGAPDPDRPRTVVLFLADTLRADHLEAWGHERSTAPTLARLADEGVRFADTVSQATWTKVSVSSILTSLYPSTTGIADFNDRVAAGETTLAEVFRAAGYATFATSSVPFSGQLTNLHQGVEVMHEFGAGASAGQEFGSKSAAVWVDKYLAWLAHQGDGPTFALIHAMDPHSPFQPRPPYDTLWADAESAARFAAAADQVRPHIESPLLRRFMAPSRADLVTAGVDVDAFVAHEKAWYDGSIRGMDAALARVVEAIEGSGPERSSLLAFVADHGEEFLEHGHHWHGRTVYGEVANVPFVLWGRGVPAGVVIDETVQTIDLMPTLLTLARLPVPERAQGRDLVPQLRGESGRAEGHPAFIEHWVPEPDEEFTRLAIIDGGWKLIRNIDGPPGTPDVELYHRAEDLLDQIDRASDQPEIVAQLTADLDRWQAWAADQRLDQDALEASMSAEQLEQLRSLGYID